MSVSVVPTASMSPFHSNKSISFAANEIFNHSIIQEDNVNVVEGNTEGGDSLTTLEVSVKFKDEKEVYEFYARYAYAVGFLIRKRTSSRDDAGKLNTVHLEHNHETSPTKSRLYRYNRVLSAHLKWRLEVNDIARIPLHKSFNSAVIEAGGYENMTCVEKDCRNYIKQVRRLRLGEGDAAAIQSYFSEMQAQCSGFFFSIDLDDDSRTWLKCMGGKAPHEIITDQDRVMQNAIEIIFPNTKHRWCLWHILKKLPEKFGYHVDKASIFSTIHVLVYDSQSIEEFEESWRDMIKMYKLHDNVWLSELYENRVRWVPYFPRTTFCASMLTTQRSKSMNAFFDGYVHAKTSLKQFVEQYERALRNKVKNEFIADFKSFS
ncbi:protein FAR1-RELATED SEQUENCE 1-like [Olea europaea var. sylvestris]|uniref:protein FAR1-RELATED SEQUENCE 1-like n=1 Tax=Olea europaea var. sylvestris TaxID=158386 RepID=UPI000C1CF230|nr:protein FAR1-RELATED SEQUENCE 1-like [Olea europaea var. sylvestris]